jgi:hypothetical protein
VVSEIDVYDFFRFHISIAEINFESSFVRMDALYESYNRWLNGFDWYQATEKKCFAQLMISSAELMLFMHRFVNTRPMVEHHA